MLICRLLCERLGILVIYAISVDDVHSSHVEDLIVTSDKNGITAGQGVIGIAHRQTNNHVPT